MARPISEMECPDCSRPIEPWEAFSATILDLPLGTTETLECPQCGVPLLASRRVEIEHSVERRR
jgi:DNA-directed RNA polymerase subunit RPC12/RpoP